MGQRPTKHPQATVPWAHSTGRVRSMMAVGARCWTRAMAASTVEHEQGDPRVDLLTAVRAETRLAAEAEARRLELVVGLCQQHQVEETESATYVESAGTPASRS